MTEEPETDVNKDYITPPAGTYTHRTARDAFQLKSACRFKAAALTATAYLCLAHAPERHTSE